MNKFMRTSNIFNPVQPSAPPVPKYNQSHFISSPSCDQYNSNSSVDSLFDSEEIKQFEKKYNPQKNDSEEQYHNNQKMYNGIYPSLHEVSQVTENYDSCSI